MAARCVAHKGESAKSVHSIGDIERQYWGILTETECRLLRSRGESMNAIKALTGLLLAGLSLLLLGVACGQDTASSATTPSLFQAPPTTRAELTATPSLARPAEGSSESGRVPHDYGSSLQGHFGAATASLEERVYMADVVVKARFVSETDSTLTFRAVSYLKGSGPTEFTVRAVTEGRDTQWDSQDAMLFLSTLTGQIEHFEFVDTTEWDYMWPSSNPTEYTGKLPDGYTLGRNNPVWLPVTSAPSSGGVSGQAPQAESSTQIATDIESGKPVSVTQQDLEETIRWITGATSQASGQGAQASPDPAEYQDCVLSSLEVIRNARDVEAYTGSEFAPKTGTGVTLESGEAQGLEVLDFSQGATQHYIPFEVSGPNSDLFSTNFSDDDGDSITGYQFKIVTARPLPAGTYTLRSSARPPWLEACKFRHPDFYVAYPVEVVAPGNITHEAFFDPATTTAGVGYLVGPATTTGVLKPAAFSVGSVSTNITGLHWQSGSVVLSLSPFVSLGNNQLEFIGLDGTTALALRVSDATADSAAGTLTWAVADKPWSAGDQLMLRIGPDSRQAER